MFIKKKNNNNNNRKFVCHLWLYSFFFFNKIKNGITYNVRFFDNKK